MLPTTRFSSAFGTTRRSRQEARRMDLERQELPNEPSSVRELPGSFIEVSIKTTCLHFMWKRPSRWKRSSGLPSENGNLFKNGMFLLEGFHDQIPATRGRGGSVGTKWDPTDLGDRYHGSGGNIDMNEYGENCDFSPLSPVTDFGGIIKAPCRPFPDLEMSSRSASYGVGGSKPSQKTQDHQHQQAEHIEHAYCTFLDHASQQI